ncbi:molecular chaperone Skp [Sulfurifustis variabilis]|uniref:Molecular chaperone Skp n=1 Tax=Sulfurifustis variabilis TaxID=1675686 RepID=A0A1B4V779_9GAMM|nr:OmpH family outer membrane protein [Sulfurifustis variabilis]BAU47174.1 molecular chaperone Skp [Sulfurifustis variabilis]
MKHWMLAVVFAVTLLPAWPGPALGADVRIGYVDMRRVLTESKAGKQVKAEIEKTVKKRQEKLAGEEQKLKEMQQSYEKDKLILSEAQRQEKQKEFEQRLNAYRQATAEAQREIQQQEQAYTKKALPEVRDIIRDLAKEEKLTLVFEKHEMPVLYAAEGPDLTDKIIKRLDAKPGT